MAKKDDPKPAEKVVYKDPKRIEPSGGGFGALVGLIGILIGLYPLLNNFGVIDFEFIIPEIATSIILIIASAFLLVEAGKRSALVRAKRKFDHLIHQ